MRQAKLQSICEGIVDDLDGVLGCSVVDLNTGLPVALGVKPRSLVSSDAMEFISAAAVRYFANAQEEADAGSILGGPGNTDDFVQEIQTTTEATYHFMSLVSAAERELLILVTDRHRSNLGLGWMALRQAAEQIRNADGGDAVGTEPEAGVEPNMADPAAALVTNLQSKAEILNRRSKGRRTIWGHR